MDTVIELVPLAIVIVLIFWSFKRTASKTRAARIDSFSFPTGIETKVIEKYPHLTADQTKQVMLALREYFQICLMAGKQNVSMPSQVVDTAWHEFILFTRHYHYFCHKALGRFLHHTPAEAMQSQTMAQAGIKTAWKLACQREKIDPKHPERLPLLFSIDADLEISDGFKYSLNCKNTQDGYCAGHISSCGGGGCSGSSCGSSCGSGCGGD